MKLPESHHRILSQKKICNSSVASTALSNPTISPPVITVADVQPVVPQSSSPAQANFDCLQKKGHQENQLQAKEEKASEPEEKSAKTKMLEKLKEKNVSPEEIENLFTLLISHSKI